MIVKLHTTRRYFAALSNTGLDLRGAGEVRDLDEDGGVELLPGGRHVDHAAGQRLALHEGRRGRHCRERGVPDFTIVAPI